MSDAPPRRKSLVIAIDGPSAAGKGTLGRRLAARYGLAYLDTGLIYRAVAARLLAEGGNPADEDAAERAARAMMPADLFAAGLRDEKVGAAASVVAAHPGVRAGLVDFQRRFAAHPPDLGPGRPARGAVLDGRDIGTWICPDADIKFFMTAVRDARAGRRHRELLARGEAAIYARVLQDMEARDVRDAGREAAPLRPAPDAFVIDSSELDADAVFERAVAHIDDIVRRDRQSTA
ncbi:MAG: (d)CMP kinase [Rhodospirillaceae bacterium]|nr:(d)CMP kinase [Rhodospirillaceae bacterium]